MLDIPTIRVDASTFQKPVASLAETLAQKVLREGRKTLSGPEYVSQDIFVLIRTAKAAFSFFCYLHADERIQDDAFWRKEYTNFALGSIRTMIDLLFNITLILRKPELYGRQFRLTGLRRSLQNLENEKTLYGCRPEWQRHLRETNQRLRLRVRQSGFDPDDMPDDKFKWPTLGVYLGNKIQADDEIKHFLRTLTLGSWREYSQVLHATFDGLVGYSSFLVQDQVPHDRRHEANDAYPYVYSMHGLRSALLLQAINTEVQAYFRFRDAQIDERLRSVWVALSPVYEAREFLATRYSRFMRASGIGNWCDEATSTQVIPFEG